jgi:hypothetical protein
MLGQHATQCWRRPDASASSMAWRPNATLAVEIPKRRCQLSITPPKTSNRLRHLATTRPSGHEWDIHHA